jgi:hypothetical protein
MGMVVTVLASAVFSDAGGAGAGTVGRVGSAGSCSGPDMGAAGCWAGSSKTRKSLAPSRRSCHGSLSAGSPNVWPPRLMLNRSA